ncbi:MAG TPA: RagB/SusD family nutrient uptake outer membrane protein [Bacteroidales bacterium]|nr:RagB/SusD family nutrient uptake outer membrane protein [Bacteroidales bacterium]
MKRYITSLILIIALVSSCTDDYLQVENKGSLTVENWYNTADDFQAALNSAYIPMMENGMFALDMTLTFGTFEDRTLFENTGRDRFSTMYPSSGDASNTWGSLYFGVYRTSKLLSMLNEKGVDGIEGMTAGNFDYIAAQARALRGMYYFYLTIIFDRPILYDENSLPDNYSAVYSNANQSDLWNQIEKDFTDAYPDLKLRSGLDDAEFGRVTSGAAMAQLAKSLLYKHYYYYERFGLAGSDEDIADLTKARDYFKQVIDSHEYALIQPQAPKTRKDYLYAILCNSSFVDLPSENNIYDSENNIESVWEVQFGDDQAYQNNPWLNGYFSGGALNEQYFSPHEASYRNHEAHPAMYYAFETEGAPAPFDRDPRCYASFYFDGDLMDFNPNSDYYIPFKSGLNSKKVAQMRGLTLPAGTQSLGVKKTHFPVYWDGPLAPSNDPVNKRVIRYADVLLMYAEVMYLTGDDGSGLDALNQVRRRVDMPDISALTTQAIIHERDVELAFEDHRWFDLVRWSFSLEWGIDWSQIDWGIDANNSVNPFTKNKNEFLPIPLSEINVNDGALKQNPGW